MKTVIFTTFIKRIRSRPGGPDVYRAEKPTLCTSVTSSVWNFSHSRFWVEVTKGGNSLPQYRLPRTGEYSDPPSRIWNTHTHTCTDLLFHVFQFSRVNSNWTYSNEECITFLHCGLNPTGVMWEFSALTVSYLELGVLRAQWKGSAHRAEHHPLCGCVHWGVTVTTRLTPQVLQFLGLVNTGITRTVRGWVSSFILFQRVGGSSRLCAESSQTEMDLHSIIRYHLIYRCKIKLSQLLWSFMPGTSVSVFLPLSLPEAVLIKAFKVRECTWEDWWRDVMAVCSLEGTLTHSDSMT